MLSDADRKKAADILMAAQKERKQAVQLHVTFPDITIEDSYAISTDVMQRKADRQHPETQHGQEAEHAAAGQRDACRHAHPDGLRLTQAVEVASGPVRHVVLQPVHFLVKVGFARHARSKGPCADLFRR